MTAIRCHITATAKVAALHSLPQITAKPPLFRGGGSCGSSPLPAVLKKKIAATSRGSESRGSGGS